ncbi:MAG TPA: CorA family divalent cation transporter [Acidimicrobiales bacterium]|jgi:magnesium transporter|nr:CorA family divalent cation transporter [Acidimicrobiales bacterium]
MAAAWAVIDAVIDKCERVVDALDDQLERIEVAVFEGDEEQSQPIYLRLQEAVRLARLMHPTLTVLDRLERGELVECPSALAPLFGDVSDRARRLSDEVTMLGEALDGLLNVNLARVTVRQNVIIQQVSAWAAIAAAATIITGIYGMNFRHMPALARSWATRWRSRS